MQHWVTWPPPSDPMGGAGAQSNSLNPSLSRVLALTDPTLHCSHCYCNNRHLVRLVFSNTEKYVKLRQNITSIRKCHTCVCPFGLSGGIRQQCEFPSNSCFPFHIECMDFQNLWWSGKKTTGFHMCLGKWKDLRRLLHFSVFLVLPLPPKRRIMPTYLEKGNVEMAVYGLHLLIDP